jgi:hypothetical protein
MVNDLRASLIGLGANAVAADPQQNAKAMRACLSITCILNEQGIASGSRATVKA